MHRFFPSNRLTLSVTALALGLAASACNEDNVLGIDDETCKGADCAASGSGGTGKAGSGGATGSGGRVGNGLPTGGTGGTSNGGTGGGSGGSSGSGGAGPTVDSDGGIIDAGEPDSSLPPIPDFTLVVDEPHENDAVSGTITVKGRAPAFLNVEIWDDTHQMPPLAQAVPDADGDFSMTVDTSELTSGAVTWTVHAWDSAPGEDFMHTATVMLHLTIDDGVVNPGNGDIGSGDIDEPVEGPEPTDMDEVGGADFVLVKNWDFGSGGTITNIDVLSSEFDYHDNFGTIANGTNYGSVTVAATEATAINASNLGLPNNKQPVEDPARKNREFTADVMRAHVRPLSASDTTCTVSSHDTGNGSITAKWRLPNGGSRLGMDLLWETRVRMPKPLLGYWFAIWTVGNQWNNGAEMDVMESFGGTNIWPTTTWFHSDAVPSSASDFDYFGSGGWPAGMNEAGLPPSDDTDLKDWHTYTWIYRKDNTYKVYFDGHVVQQGTLHWTNGASSNGTAIDLAFVLDLGWGHTVVPEVKDISMPCSNFPLTYEVDYSRVYLRE